MAFGLYLNISTTAVEIAVLTLAVGAMLYAAKELTEEKEEIDRPVINPIR